MDKKENDIIEVDYTQLMTPLNLAKKFIGCGLTSSQIGYAYHIGAVKGIKPRGARTSLIYIESFRKFLEYRNSLPTLVVKF